MTATGRRIAVGAVAACAVTVAIAVPLASRSSHHPAGSAAPPRASGPPHPRETGQPGQRRPLVGSAAWERTSLGARLRVRPTAYGRQHAASAPTLALDQALTDAGRTPLQLTGSIRQALVDQLHCHAVFASAKPRWNLETWRPDVGYARTVLALCNP
jgi:hypothetical protein